MKAPMPCEIQQNRPIGLREIRDRAKFFLSFLWAPVVPICLSGPTTPLFGQNLGCSSLNWHRSEKRGVDILKAPMLSIHPANFSKIAP